MNNLNEILNFIKKNKNYSDLNLINSYLTNLNFTNYKGGANLPIYKEDKWVDPTNDQPINPQPVLKDNIWYDQTNEPINPQPIFQDNTWVYQDTQLVSSEQQQIQPEVVEQQQIQPEVVEQQQMQPEVAEQQIQQTDPSEQQSINTIDDSEQNCITTTLKNKFGSIIEQITCKNKIITLPNLLIKPTIINSEVNTFTIKSGTILYHASKIRGFNPNEIKLGKDNLISFFTPNFKLASFKIKGCDLDELNSYIHTFEVVKDIRKIFIKLPYTTGNINIDDLKNEFCTNKIYNGVGFFFPKNDIEIFNNALIDGNSIEIEKLQNNDYYYSEFALCNPNEWLKYLVSHSCKSYRSLSPAFRMNS
jgi:hypothetical protein